MKRFARITAFVCVCVILVTCLTSCNYLDELKDQRVLVLDFGKETLEYKGTKYKLIDNPKNVKMNCLREETFYAVDPEIPLLVMLLAGEYCYYSPDKDVLLLDSPLRYYCTLDKYEEYSEIVGSAEFTKYKFEYRLRDPATARHTQTVSYILDSETEALINKVRSKDYIEKNSNMVTVTDDYRSWAFIELDLCDEKDLIEVEDAVTLCKDNYGCYYLYLGEGKGDDGVYANIVVFAEKDKELLRELFNDYTTLGGAYYDEYVAY